MNVFASLGLLAIDLILLALFGIRKAGRKGVKGLHTATAVLESLSKIRLPDLPRPAIPETNANDELCTGA
jgi:hypothetical protein